MKHEKWLLLRKSFDQALNLDAEAQAEIVSELRRSDPQLGEELERLLAHADKPLEVLGCMESKIKDGITE